MYSKLQQIRKDLLASIVMEDAHFYKGATGPGASAGDAKTAASAASEEFPGSAAVNKAAVEVAMRKAIDSGLPELKPSPYGNTGLYMKEHREILVSAWTAVLLEQTMKDCDNQEMMGKARMKMKKMKAEAKSVEEIRTAVLAELS